MTKLVNVPRLERGAAKLVGSSPSLGTNMEETYMSVLYSGLLNRRGPKKPPWVRVPSLPPFFGSVLERFNRSVLKTEVLQSTVGSNPTASSPK